jgi:hypothetical protein
MIYRDKAANYPGKRSWSQPMRCLFTVPFSVWMVVLTVAGDAAWTAEFRLATFEADVTPPLGHPLLGGTTTPPPAHAIDDPLLVRGFVLAGGDRPLVLASIDWCEIRNDAYDRWREALAEAAGTTRERVLLTSIHQHDAPLADLEAQRILDRSTAGGALIDFDYHERCVRAAAEALRASLANAVPVTHVGVGHAPVEQVASNRRYVGPDGQPRFDRSSMSGGDPVKRDAFEGTIDPVLRTISFWNGDTLLCALHSYAVHPMSQWGSGRVTADFPGLARRLRQADDPAVFQIYASGCSGNTTAGKFNDGSLTNRPILAERLHKAMILAWEQTRRTPLERIEFRNAPFHLPLREDAGHTTAELESQLAGAEAKKRNLAALALSWRRRAERGQPIDLPVIDLGPALIALLPGETYVEFQLLAQSLRPDVAVMALGYGECAPGFVPIETAWQEHDGNLTSWCWVGPGAEKLLTDALRKALGSVQTP